MNPCITSSRLSLLYSKYNKREFVHPDPLEFLYNYPDPTDREIVGLIASCLAYGSVKQILKTVDSVLKVMRAPRAYFEKRSRSSIARDCRGFKYRFTTENELCSLLIGIKSALQECGSLEALFMRSYDENHENIVPALCAFVSVINADLPGPKSSLLPHPQMGSACKRLNLYLRWMVRQDDVDPGGWTGIKASQLLVPMDVHMHRISLMLGLTNRKQANLKAACEVTGSFKMFEPGDPVKYDFALTRFGIRDDMDPCNILEDTEKL